MSKIGDRFEHLFMLPFVLLIIDVNKTIKKPSKGLIRYVKVQMNNFFILIIT